MKDPGYEEDLVVAAAKAMAAGVWAGASPFAQAVREGGLRLDGPRDVVRAFRSRFLLSHFAHVEQPARVG